MREGPAARGSGKAGENNVVRGREAEFPHQLLVDPFGRPLQLVKVDHRSAESLRFELI